MSQKSEQAITHNKYTELYHLSARTVTIVVMFRYKGQLSFSDAATWDNSDEGRKGAHKFVESLTKFAPAREYAEIRIEQRVVESQVILQAIMPGCINAS